LAAVGLPQTTGIERQCISYALRPDNPRIMVVSTAYRIDEVDKDPTHAEVYVGCSELGHLSSDDLRFTPSPPGPPIVEMICTYKLVATSDVRPEWKILDGPSGLHVDVDTAVRYVTDRRDNSSDPVKKKNADATITALRRSK
jgi:hypothetical protein